MKLIRCSLGIFALAFLLGACSPTIFSRVDQVEKGIIEPRVDATYDETIKRWCRAPVDIHRRAIDRKAITPRSLTDNCSDWRAIRDALIGDAMGRLGMETPQ